MPICSIVQVKVHRIYPNTITICVSDVQPPTFVTCPGGPLLAYAERDKFSALVNWTEPVAIDNSGVTPTVTSNYQSPQRFSQGTHVITYTAVDQSGNKATCSFTVKVLGNKIFHHVFQTLLSIFLSNYYPDTEFLYQFALKTHLYSS